MDSLIAFLSGNADGENENEPLARQQDHQDQEEEEEGWWDQIRSALGFGGGERGGGEGGGGEAGGSRQRGQEDAAAEAVTAEQMLRQAHAQLQEDLADKQELVDQLVLSENDKMSQIDRLRTALQHHARLSLPEIDAIQHGRA